MTKQVTTLQQYLPVTFWLPRYIATMVGGNGPSGDKGDFSLLMDDVIGGLTIGVMCIPQCM